MLERHRSLNESKLNSKHGADLQAHEQVAFRGMINVGNSAIEISPHLQNNRNYS